MNVFHDRHSVLTVALASLWLAACNVDVREEGRDKNVDIRTPFGDISVRSDERVPETGLPVYPGAQPLLDEDEERESADIKVATSFFGLHVAAAKFESSDAPPAIVDFYKDRMSAHGAVVECTGEIDFEDESKQPKCKEQPGSPEIQLVAGIGENHKLVAVKPRGTGSEFAVVSVQLDEGS